ncbi:MAG: hypothetical protein NT118_02300 [Lentisphaerae bacterium]|nr:hypothetical protein [Lentisphaerota bacterium]
MKNSSLPLIACLFFSYYLFAESTNSQNPCEIRTLKSVCHDSARNRDVPVKIYFPASAGKYPVIIFSHGLGGTCEGYEYLGTYWAQNDYISVHIQHKGSDDEVWKDKPNPMESMRRAAKDLGSIFNRPKDVAFAIDQIGILDEDEKSELREKCDMDRVGVAGHSFGAYTALASSGRILVGPLGGKTNLSDPRIKACIAMSSPGSERERKNNSYGNYSVPCLHMTGTEDVSPVADTKAADRRIPFDSIEKNDQYLVTFNGGDHMIFSGRLRKTRKEENDKIFQELIKQSTVEFWNAYLKNNSESKKWLTGGDFEKVMGDKAVVEKKIKM